jgi:hypothetical protein
VFTGNAPGESQTRMHMARDWAARSDEKADQKVFAFSNAQQVELSLNGKSLGSQALPADGSARVWMVPFSHGHP